MYCQVNEEKTPGGENISMQTSYNVSLPEFEGATKKKNNIAILVYLFPWEVNISSPLNDRNFLMVAK